MTDRVPTLLPARQRRSMEARDRLIEMATELLAEVGWDGFTVAEVSRRSGVSVGAIYQRVPNKAALVRAVNDRTTERLASEHVVFEEAERWRALPTPRLVDEAVGELVAHFRRHAALLRALIRRAGSDPAMAQRGAAGVADLGSSFQRLLLTRSGEIAHDDPGRAVAVAWRILWSTLAWRAAWGEEFETPEPADWDELATDLAATTRAYLLAPASGPSGG